MRLWYALRMPGSVRRRVLNSSHSGSYNDGLNLILQGRGTGLQVANWRNEPIGMAPTSQPKPLLSSPQLSDHVLSQLHAVLRLASSFLVARRVCHKRTLEALDALELGLVKPLMIL